MANMTRYSKLLTLNLSPQHEDTPKSITPRRLEKGKGLKIGQKENIETENIEVGNVGGGNDASMQVEEFSTISPSPMTWWTLFDRGLSVIISLISTAVYTIIVMRTNRFELTLVIIGIFLLWMMIDGYMRDWISNFWSFKNNVGWQAVLFDSINFISLLGIFLVSELLLGNFVNVVNNSNASLFEVAVAIYVVILISYCIIQTIKMLSQ